MPGKITIGMVEFRLIEVCMHNGSLTVVRYKYLGETTIPLKCIYMALIPIKLCLIWESLNKRI